MNVRTQKLLLLGTFFCFAQACDDAKRVGTNGTTTDTCEVMTGLADRYLCKNTDEVRYCKADGENQGHIVVDSCPKCRRKDFTDEKGNTFPTAFCGDKVYGYKTPDSQINPPKVPCVVKINVAEPFLCKGENEAEFCDVNAEALQKAKEDKKTYVEGFKNADPCLQCQMKSYRASKTLTFKSAYCGTHFFRLPDEYQEPKENPNQSPPPAYVYPMTPEIFTTLQAVQEPYVSEIALERIKESKESKRLMLTDYETFWPDFAKDTDIHGENGKEIVRVGIFDTYGKERKIYDELLAPHTEFKTTGKSLAYIWQVSDPQIIDEESPIRMEGFYLQPFATASAFRPNDMYTTQILETHVRNAVRISKISGRPFDFAIVTGDVTDNAQRNEALWFDKIMTGGVVNPDSGADDNPLLFGQDWSDPFYSAGLGKIPWYIAIGNHDILYIGFMPPTELIKNAAVGDRIVDMVPDILSQFGDGKILPEVGADDMSLFGPFIRDILKKLNILNQENLPKGLKFGYRDGQTGKIVTELDARTAPDPDRKMLNKREMLEIFKNSGGFPAGHGLSDENIEQGHGNYVAYPIEGKPIKLIVLDTNGNFSEATMTAEQLNWLNDRLSEAKQKNELVILSSHHGLSRMGSPVSTVTTKQFLEVVCRYPNIALHIVGHGHRNNIVHQKCDAYGHPGYWEIMQASIADFPSQSRIIEIVLQEDNVVNIYTTNLDTNSPFNSVLYRMISAAAARRFFGKNPDDYLSVWQKSQEAGNMILRVRIPERVAQNLANHEWSERIESVTTLENFKAPGDRKLFDTMIGK